MLTGMTREFLERRIRLRDVDVPESIRQVWLGELQTPPIRWKIGQNGGSMRVSRFAMRDLAEAYQQGSQYY